MQNDDSRKILFRLVRDESGYLTADVEGLFQVDTIPFYVKEISDGDSVCAEEIDLEYQYIETVKHSPNTTVCIIVFGDRLPYLYVF